MSFCDHILAVVLGPSCVLPSVRACVRKQFLQTSSPPKTLIRSLTNFAGIILGWSSFKCVQIVSVYCISRSQELKTDFKLKTLKIFLSETNEPISIWFCRHVTLVTLYQDCSSHCDSSKNMAARGRGLFSLYFYIKNLLVRNHRSNFNIAGQKYFLGDPLLRLFKPSWFVKPLGGGAYFPYISI